MKKKVEFDLIFGYFLFIVGTFSVGYAFIVFIINIALIPTGFFILIKDISFDLVFILLGLLIIRKKKTKNSYNQ
ncbi:MAG: hypothetical protein ACFFCE_11640 [Promethearchaeota archaeon]